MATTERPKSKTKKTKQVEPLPDVEEKQDSQKDDTTVVETPNPPPPEEKSPGKPVVLPKRTKETPNPTPTKEKSPGKPGVLSRGTKVVPQNTPETVTNENAAVILSSSAWSSGASGEQEMVVVRDSQSSLKRAALREERSVYVPYLYARNCIAKMEDDILLMKSEHIRLVSEIQIVYADIEEESDRRFQEFVFALRSDYGGKLVMYRRIIDALREQVKSDKIQYETLVASLAARNATLLEEQSVILKHHHDQLAALEKDKLEMEQRMINQQQLSSPAAAVLDVPETKIVRDQLQSEKLMGATVPLVAGAGPVAVAPAVVPVVVPVVAPVVVPVVAAVASIPKRDQTTMTTAADDQDDLRKSNAIWQAKYDAVAEQLAALAELRIKYEQMQTVLATVTAMGAKVEDTAKCEEALRKCEDDQKMMEEERANLAKQVDKWEANFKKKHGRAPTDADRGDTQLELATQLAEVNTMLASLDTQRDTLIALKEGHMPAPPSPALIALQAPEEPVVRVVEVAVRDPSQEVELARLQALVSELQSRPVAVEPQLVAVDSSRVAELEAQLAAMNVALVVATSSEESREKESDELRRALAALSEERRGHEATRDELESLQAQIALLRADVEAANDATGAAESTRLEELQRSLDEKNKVLIDARAEIDQLHKAGADQLSAQIQQDLVKYKERIASLEKELEAANKALTDNKAQVAAVGVKSAAVEKSAASVKKTIADLEKKLANAHADKESALQKLNSEWESREAKRAAETERRINVMESKLKVGAIPVPVVVAGRGPAGKDQQQNEKKLEALTQEVDRLKREKADLVDQMKSKGENEAEKKRHTKILLELEKKFEVTEARKLKAEEQLNLLKAKIVELDADNNSKGLEIANLTAQLGVLGVAAKEASETRARLNALEAEMKKLQAENKVLTENYNNERVLRRKYYNQIEDMKGKIRVFCRVRPMSKTELENGCKPVARSPDEYTVNVASVRGEKEFQFDQVFMPDHGQEKVFEDTYNLVQSAVDGFNVCIFAYGQTGSGKTFTMIGQKDGANPGVAPRAFNRIFELINENKSKFSFAISVYMLELYNEKLLDLFRKQAVHDDALDIKIDQKGMVFVPGAEVKIATSAQQLMDCFEEGSRNRHTASTKMNADSSRSHLVIGIVIESTNKATGQVIKGKLSLVDLAGSERVAKTGATADQLKEANSINKSLSALGDVIAALSTDQQFVPYRNNKLTRLMQDSLGGNAKTLMFVNISPADYNADESIISLTYASRVKLITNSAQKNVDSKEVARLKAMISKLKAGEAVEVEEQ